MADSAVALKRELGLRDLTLFLVCCMVGTRWVPVAAHTGPGSIVLWLLAAAFFMVPLAITVGTLVAKYPGAGGFYLWTRKDFGPWHAFLAFWTYWVGIAFWFPSAAMFYMTSGIEGLGGRYAHLAQDRVVLLAICLAAVWIALGTNLVGMKIGKWTENVGAIATWAVGMLIAMLAVKLWMSRGSASPLTPHVSASWDTASSWANFAYGMSGLEIAGLMGAEIHDPERTLPRAGWLAGGFMFLFYAGLTLAMLVILPSDKITEINGWTQSASAAAVVMRAGWLVPLVSVLVLLSAIGQFGGLGTSVSRLPFAVGVDRLLPNAFARVHPRWGTPYFSILLLGAVASFLLVAIQAGDSIAAAYRALVSLMVITGFFPYLYMFGSAWKAGRRVSAMCGAGVTLMALAASLIPTDEVHNVLLFEGKILAGTFAVVASAWVLYRRAQ